MSSAGGGKRLRNRRCPANGQTNYGTLPSASNTITNSLVVLNY